MKIILPFFVMVIHGWNPKEVKNDMKIYTLNIGFSSFAVLIFCKGLS